MLSDLDSQIEQVFTDFKRIKNEISPRRYRLLYEPFEKRLTCKTKINSLHDLDQCNCGVDAVAAMPCTKLELWDLLDICKHVIDTYDELRETRSGSEIYEDEDYGSEYEDY